MENEKQVFQKLKEFVEYGFPPDSLDPYFHGYIPEERELTQLEEELSQLGLVKYSWQRSFEREMFGPPWYFTFTEKGMKFYNDFLSREEK